MNTKEYLLQTKEVSARLSQQQGEDTKKWRSRRTAHFRVKRVQFEIMSLSSKLCLLFTHSSSLFFSRTKSLFSSFLYPQPTIHLTRAMEDTQSSRLIETTDTMKITLNHVDGQTIVNWEDIEQVFPGVKRVSNGYSVIKFLRGSDQG